MLNYVLSFFEISPVYDVDLMCLGQNLYQLTADVILGLKPILEEFKSDVMLVHGETTIFLAAAFAAFYFGAKIWQVEAGLRTYDKLALFLE